MEKVATQIKKVEQYTHFFYCDDCGAQLGCTTSHSDGWYSTLGDFELNWFTPKGWYRLEKCLCDTCKEKYLSAIYGGLESAGFQLDKY